MKSGIRLLGIDDSPFSHGDDEAFLTGVVYRGAEFVEDIRKLSIEVDADNATERVIELYESCDNTRQIKAVLVDGISLAGFNLVDIESVAETIDRPVIAVTSNEPRPEKFRDAMKDSGHYDERFEKLPEHSEVEMKDGTSYIQFAGCDESQAAEILEKATIHGLVPEPIRLADIIGRAFSG